MMADRDEKEKTLIRERELLRQRITELEHCEEERKAAEEVLRNERNKFRILSESAPFGIIMIDKEGIFEYINPKFKELFGYDLEEVPNSLEWFKKTFPDPKSRKEVISTWIDYLKSTRPGEKVPKTLPATCKDGTQKIIHFIPVRLTTGEYIVTLEDITERIQAHESLVKSHQELEAGVVLDNLDRLWQRIEHLSEWNWYHRRGSGVHLRWTLPHERNGTVRFEKTLRLWSRR